MKTTCLLMVSLALQLCSTFCPPAFAGQATSATWYRVPEAAGIVAIIDQESCDLKIESVHLAISSDRVVRRSTILRNVGNKAIRQFTIAWVTPGAGGEYAEHDLTSTPLRPGCALPATGSLADGDLPVVPKSVLAELTRDVTTPSVLIYMIVYVQYDDGSEFDARDVYKALADEYLGTVSGDRRIRP